MINQNGAAYAYSVYNFIIFINILVPLLFITRKSFANKQTNKLKYVCIYLFINGHKNVKHNASNVKIHAIGGLQE